MKQMTKFGAAALSCAAIVGGGLAGAADRTHLEGRVDRGGRVAINISSIRYQGVPYRSYQWTFRRLAVRCSGKWRIARLAVEGGFTANAEFDRPGPWGITGTAAGNPRDPSYATKVAGRLVNWHKAKGWVRVYGSRVPIRGGGSRDCDSGRLWWVARDQHPRFARRGRRP